MNGSNPRIMTIFGEALECNSAEDRAAYLDRACSGDADLRAQVEALVQAHGEAGNFLHGYSAPAGVVATHDNPIRERPGTVIGPYKLMEQIGEGGMGLVFVAEQLHPVRRKVALKVIKPGMDSREVIARFKAEQEALAVMDHPNIARVLDAGATEAGRPFFVMELVRGIPITEYCDENQLIPRQRLELFVSVCQAVQHAHQKGIIHRDIKPSNVMVTLHDGTPVVKVIDFGVAKAIGPQLTERTVYTKFMQMIGTPLYMSPEQAEMSGLDIDTRSDIYSLGVLLYELLTGTTPFDKDRLSEASYDEIRRIIREEEPPKPSTRISTMGLASTTVSAQRKSDPKRLSQLFRGELDWIVMKALEKDRNYRYETANSFAADVQRYLKHEPVLACPPSALYRFRKFAQRNGTGLAMAGLVLLFIVLLGGGVGWMVRDRAARQFVLEQEVTRALEEAEHTYKRDKRAEALAVVKRAEGLLAGGGGSEELHQRVHQWRADLDLLARLREATMQALNMDLAEDCLSYELVIPAYKAAFQAYGIDGASMPAEQAARRIASRPPEIQLALIAALDHWIDLESRFGTKSSADQQQRAWLNALVQAADTDPWRLRMRAAVEQGDYEALAELAGSPNLSKQAPYTLERLGSLLCNEAGKRDLGIRVLRRAQQAHAGNFWINYALGDRLLTTIPPQREDAVRFFAIAVALQPDSIEAHHCLGLALRRQGRLDEAMAECRKVIELQPDRYSGYTAFGIILCGQGHLDAAVAECRKAVAMNPNAGEAHACLAWCLATRSDPKRRDPAQALETARTAIRLAPQSITAWQVLGWAYYRTGDWKASIEALEKSCTLQSNGIGDTAQWFFLAMADWRLGQKAEARKWYDKAVQSETTWQGDRSRHRAEAAALLGVEEFPKAGTPPAPADK